MVHCLDGATHSALYVAAVTVCERMAYDGQVNVFLTVKEIKHRRKAALKDVVSLVNSREQELIPLI